MSRQSSLSSNSNENENENENKVEDILTDEEIEEMYDTYDISRKKYSRTDIRKWERMFQELVRYVEDDEKFDGRFSLPIGTKLGRWCNMQRTMKKSNRLLPYRVERLDEIGFKWTVARERVVHVPWETMFRRLVAYRDEYGDTNVPIYYPKDEKLGLWVKDQQALRRKGEKSLTPERMKKLDDIGFKWNDTTHDSKWDDKYDRLVEYWKKHNSTVVPRRYDDDPELGRWVGSQRVLYRKNDNRMMPERIERLEAIGFVWDAQEAAWQEMYNRLVEYKHRKGDAGVPTVNKEDPKLGRWVMMQRARYTEGKLSPDRIEKLEAIGFKWRLR